MLCRQLSVTHQTDKYILRVFVCDCDYELYQCVYTVKNCVLKCDRNLVLKHHR